MCHVTCLEESRRRFVWPRAKQECYIYITTIINVASNNENIIVIQIEKISETVRGLVTGHMTWDDVLDKYPLFTGQESTQQS